MAMSQGWSYEVYADSSNGLFLVISRHMVRFMNARYMTFKLYFAQRDVSNSSLTSGSELGKHEGLTSIARRHSQRQEPAGGTGTAQEPGQRDFIIYAKHHPQPLLKRAL
jgi:hypothetical protein